MIILVCGTITEEYVLLPPLSQIVFRLMGTKNTLDVSGMGPVTFRASSIQTKRTFIKRISNRRSNLCSRRAVSRHFHTSPKHVE